MHFEILVEDQSGKKTLEAIVPRLLGDQHTSKITSYKGLGRIPRDLHAATDPSKRILLDQLPRLLRGYGKAFQRYPAVVFVVCDLDDRCLKEFRNELQAVLDSCNPQPDVRFCMAIEETEAWLLGDRDAIKAAYPAARDDILGAYVSDSICGTWEKLADAVYPGGAASLSGEAWHAIGKEKSVWAEKIAPLMDLDNNSSPSFRHFAGKLEELSRT